MTKKPEEMTRRKALKVLGGTAGAILSAPMINLGRYQLFTWSQDNYSARAIELVEQSFVIDMCAPLTYNEHIAKKWIQSPDSFTEKDWEPFETSGFKPSVRARIGYDKPLFKLFSK